MNGRYPPGLSAEALNVGKRIKRKIIEAETVKAEDFSTPGLISRLERALGTLDPYGLDDKQNKVGGGDGTAESQGSPDASLGPSVGESTPASPTLTAEDIDAGRSAESVRPAAPCVATGPASISNAGEPSEATVLPCAASTGEPALPPKIDARPGTGEATEPGQSGETDTLLQTPSVASVVSSREAETGQLALPAIPPTSTEPSDAPSATPATLNDEIRNELIALAHARRILDAANTVVQESRKQWEVENAESLALASDARSAVERLELAARISAEALFAVTGERKPTAGIEVKEFTTLKYDDVRALEWARQSGSCIMLDRGAFTKVAKTGALDFVVIDKEPRATIATDLPKALGLTEAS